VVQFYRKNSSDSLSIMLETIIATNTGLVLLLAFLLAGIFFSRDHFRLDLVPQKIFQGFFWRLLVQNISTVQMPFLPPNSVSALKD